MRFRTKKLRNLAATYWQPTIFYGMLIIFFGLLLWFQLGALLGGYSAEEGAALVSGTSLRDVLEHPINAPFSILTYLFSLAYSGDQHLLPVRAAATVFGLLTLTTFYWLVRHWHGERSAVLGTILFGCSAWFLHTSRLGTPDVLFFLLLALAAGSVWLKRTDNRTLLLLGFGLIALLLYVPGMIWFILIGCAWQARTVGKLLKGHPGFMALGLAIALVLLAPLAWAISKTPELAKVVAGLPADGWPQLLPSLQRLADIPYSLVVRTPLDPLHWLGRLPLLDGFSVAMLALGLYMYVRHWRLVRSKMVGLALILGSLLIALGGEVSLPILAPFIYLLVAAGIGLLLDRWLKVFPRNTIAQAVSVGLVSLAVIAASWYGLRHYFVAWPNAPATKQVFTIR